MGYKYEATSENSDATTSYNILGNFPVKFETFFREILKNSNSFLIEFGASNEEFGGWLGNRLEVSKDLKTNICYLSRQEPGGWYEQIKDLEITKCWANGGWGQMSYIVTFAENATVGGYENEEVNTNADRIRAMSDEELAEFLEGEYGNFATGCALGWLKQPKKEG